MMEAADRNARIISVAENYRLARIQRTRSWAIAQGRIGDPRMFFWVEASEGLGKWGWRNFKMDAGGGWALDGGVHFTDLMRFILGMEAEEVYAINKAYEPFRYDNPAEREGGYAVDVEDAMIATIKFEQGVTAQWTWVGSAPGHHFNPAHRLRQRRRARLEQRVGAAQWRNRSPNDELMQEFTNSLSDSEREYYFPGGMGRYRRN